MKKSSLLFSLFLSLFAISAQATIHTGRFECERGGKVIRSISISTAKIGALELPVIEMKNPITGSSFSGVATVVRTDSGTNYILNPNAAIYFQDNGMIVSEDDCKQVE